jgi:hypothetical protein
MGNLDFWTKHTLGLADARFYLYSGRMWGGPLYVHSTNSTWTYAGPHRRMQDHTDVRYFMKYPLVNT